MFSECYSPFTFLLETLVSKTRRKTFDFAKRQGENMTKEPVGIEVEPSLRE